MASIDEGLCKHCLSLDPVYISTAFLWIPSVCETGLPSAEHGPHEFLHHYISVVILSLLRVRFPFGGRAA